MPTARLDRWNGRQTFGRRMIRATDPKSTPNPDSTYPITNPDRKPTNPNSNPNQIIYCFPNVWRRNGLSPKRMNELIALWNISHERGEAQNELVCVLRHGPWSASATDQRRQLYKISVGQRINRLQDV